MAEPPYSVHSVRPDFIDAPTLDALFQYCAAQPETSRLALIGFNEYAKHLVNMFPDRTVGFHDPEPWKEGISFRGKTVAGREETFDATNLVVCDYTLAYDYADEVARRYDKVPSVFVPPRFGQKFTHMIDPFAQESLYRQIFSRAAEAPPTMMSRDKICLLMECLRQGLSGEGEVLEIGVWQGGSSWYLAQVLNRIAPDRQLYLVDVFENQMNTTATVCTEEVRRKLSFYEKAVMLVGSINSAETLNRLCASKFCFIHCDLGFNHARPALERLWECMVPGAALLFDNYGHAPTQPVALERFFAERHAHVIRFPWSEQGLVIR